jgi:5-methylcytosine-specific restriction endonuclease McrA
VQRRRREVKRQLVTEAGGACVLCGYDRALSGLHFHHLSRADKTFGLSREGVTRALETARAEARKCVLLCSNCHAEVEAGAVQLPPSLLL